MWFLLSSWFFHSAQYLVVTTSVYLKERGLPPNISFSQIATMLRTPAFARYFALLFVVGFSVSFLFPQWLMGHQPAAGIAFACVFVTVNLHHFITDSFIWKLRDPVLQKLLVA